MGLKVTKRPKMCLHQTFSRHYFCSDVWHFTMEVYVDRVSFGFSLKWPIRELQLLPQLFFLALWVTSSVQFSFIFIMPNHKNSCHLGL